MNAGSSLRRMRPGMIARICDRDGPFALRAQDLRRCSLALALLGARMHDGGSMPPRAKARSPEECWSLQRISKRAQPFGCAQGRHVAPLRLVEIGSLRFPATHVAGTCGGG